MVVWCVEICGARGVWCGVACAVWWWCGVTCGGVACGVWRCGVSDPGPACGEVGGRLFLVRLTTLPPLRAASRVVVPAAAAAGLPPAGARRTRLGPPQACLGLTLGC